MKATVLIDNIAENELIGEWGLSILIEYGDKKVLLDTGKSEKFAENAKKLSADLSTVDFGVLSHAHYDHADGMGEFFKENKQAKFYLRQTGAENCYKKTRFFHKYIGIQKGLLDTYRDRIVFADGDCQVVDGCYLIPHKLESSFPTGKMCVKMGRRWYPDKFEHEQSLVFDTDKGLVIFNSCSHTGADTILREVAMTFPDKKIHAFVGGFHLYDASEEKIRNLARGILQSDVEQVYTGHCTGQAAYDILKTELGEKLQQLKTGLVIEF